MTKIALFIPCYNEAKRLDVEAVAEFIAKSRNRIHFFFIDDGSKDGTKEIILSQLVDNVHSFFIPLVGNRGKGNAIREGIMTIATENEYEYYGFIDADLEIPLGQVLELYAAIEKEPYHHLAISCRDLFENFDFWRLRSYGSLGVMFLGNKIIGFKPRLKDTQCGCKLFSKDILEICFKEEFISGWLFDLEIFLRLRNNHPSARKSIVQVPLPKLNVTKNSNVRIKSTATLVSQFFKVNSFYNR